VVRSPIYSTAVGLARYGARGHRGVAPEASEGTLVTRVRDWLSSLF